MYLTTRQALADLEVFIKSKTKKNLRNAKWVVFGGSYPGSLAAWSRMKFPHLVHAAVSSSSIINTKIDNKGTVYNIYIYNALFKYLFKLSQQTYIRHIHFISNVFYTVYYITVYLTNKH